MMKPTKRILLFGLLLTTFVLFSGCATTARYHSSSVVDYLYPKEKDYTETPAVPRLALPLTVGIAFVPEPDYGNKALTEIDKMDLMKDVKAHFSQFDFVKSIELIPSAYLRNQGSFANLDQIRTMYGVDVIALLSYDATQFTDEGLASITYWTLVGAYLVPGEKNDTHTMVDAAVYDIQSRKMLFRAPGVSHIKSKATPINLSEQLRLDRIESFEKACEDLVVNLDIQLEQFREKVKEAPEEYLVVKKAEYRGGGSLDLSWILLLSLLGGIYGWQRRVRAS